MLLSKRIIRSVPGILLAIMLTAVGANAAITPTLLSSGAGYDGGNPNTYTADLTTLGISDWIQWGGNGDITPIRKESGGSQLSDASLTGNGGEAISLANTPNGAPTLSWSDGTPVGTSTGNRNGIFTNQTFGFGQGLKFSAICTGGSQTLTVFTGTYNADYTLSAQLFDGATPSGSAVTTNVSGQGYRDGFAAIQYDFSGTASQTLQFSIVTTSKPGDFSGTQAYLYGATLSNGVVVIPEASTGFSLLLGGMGLFATTLRRRKR